MEVQIRPGPLARRPAGVYAVMVPLGAGAPTAKALGLDRSAEAVLAAPFAVRDVSGRIGDVCVLYVPGMRGRMLMIGLGDPRSIDVHRVRLAAAVAARRARDLRARTLALALPEPTAKLAIDPVAAAQAAAEGVVLGHWRHTAYHTEPSPALNRVELVAGDAAAARALAPAVARGARWAEAACIARDLASTPGQDLTPEGLGARAVDIARTTGARAEVMGPAQLERLGMGALLGVGRGSAHPPRFIVLERPARRKGAPTVVLIGKGVTFDTGGISLKPAPDMHRMKYDMSGAAAVLGVFSALPALDDRQRVIGLIPSAENMPGGRALKPGDVLRAMDGTTIEVTNTDAEGRLILADALCYAQRYEPAAVVDLATLTGSITIALGHHAAGLFSTRDALADELLAAGARAGERLWRFPLWPDYEPQLVSDTADILNSAGREGGAILGATFLKRFARGMPWAHLDIASTAWAPSDRPHERRGPTGFGVRLLLEWLSARVDAAPAGGASRASRDRVTASGVGARRVAARGRSRVRARAAARVSRRGASKRA